MARDLLTLVKAKKKRQPITVGGAPKAPAAPSAPRWGTAEGATALTAAWKKANAPRWGTAAGNNALRAAWSQANPGKTAPAEPARWGTEEGAKALEAAWQAANPGKTLDGGSSGGGQSASAPKLGPLADDAQAAAERAKAIFEVTQKRASLQTQGAIEASDLDEAIRRLRLQRPDDERGAQNQANNAGLFYSGALVRQMGDIGTRYVRDEGDRQTNFSRAETGRRAQLAEAEQQQTLTFAAIDAALAERETQRAAARAEAGTLAGPDGQDNTPAPASPAPTAPPAATAQQAPAEDMQQAQERLRQAMLVRQRAAAALAAEQARRRQAAKNKKKGRG